jgi:hypothetical protein
MGVTDDDDCQAAAHRTMATRGITGMSTPIMTTTEGRYRNVRDRHHHDDR